MLDFNVNVAREIVGLLLVLST